MVCKRSPARFVRQCLWTSAIALSVAAPVARSAAGQPQPAAGASETWPVFRGTALATGVAPCRLPNPLALQWQFRVKGGAFDSTPAVAEGQVFIADLDGAIFGLDVETGKQVWKVSTDSSFVAPMAYRDGRVYVGDIDGVFYCLDARRGKLLWKHEADAEIDGGAGFHGDHVLFTSQDGGLYCLDARTGARIWKYSIDNQIRCSLTVVENRAFLAGCDAVLHIVDLKRGTELEGVDISAPTGVTPAARGDRIYFGTEGGDFFCVDWRHAKVAWTFSDPERRQSIRSSAALTANTAVFGSRGKRVYAVDLESGKLAWEFTTRRHIDASPLVADTRVFVATSGGHLYALDVSSGKTVWDFEAGDGFTGSPVAATGRLLIAGNDGVVYCFGPRQP